MTPKCPTGFIALERGCGHHQAVPTKCKSILCPDCERERAGKIHERWTPIIEALPDVKLMTLTIKNGEELVERLSTLDKSFRRLLDIRIGKNNRNKIRRKVEKKLNYLVAKTRLTQEKADQWLRSTDSWLKYCARYEAQKGKSFKMRQLFAGLSSLEITYGKMSKASTLLRKIAKLGLPQEEQKRVNATKRSLTNTEGICDRISQLIALLSPLEARYGYPLANLLYQLGQIVTDWQKPDGWHVHRHLIVSMRYLPQIVLSTLWDWATKGEGIIVDIRAPTNADEGVRETLKYTTKAWEIPEDKHDELLKATHRKKRLWVIGRLKPIEQPKAPCPGCDKPDCSCKLVVVLSDEKAIIKNVVYVGEIHDGISYVPVTIILARDHKKRLVWDATPIKGDDPNCHFTGIGYQENSQQAQGLPANHDPPVLQIAFETV